MLAHETDKGARTREVQATVGDHVVKFLVPASKSSMSLLARRLMPAELFEPFKVRPMPESPFPSIFLLAVIGVAAYFLLYPDHWVWLILFIAFLVMLIFHLVAQYRARIAEHYGDQERSQQLEISRSPMIVLWHDHLYYCIQDDKVFLRGRPQTVPPEEMVVILEPASHEDVHFG